MARSAFVSLSLAVLLTPGLFMMAAGCSRREPEAPVRTGEPGRARKAATAPEQKVAETARPAKKEPNKEGGGSMLTAPVDYLNTVTVKSRRYARKTVGLLEVKREIQAFYAMKGRYPKSLDELVEWSKAELPKLPRGQSFSYNPETGEAAVVP